MTQARIGHALVVGAVHEPSADAPPPAVVDAERMTRLLRARGFEVVTLAGPDATRDRILAAYEALIERVDAADAAVFYFSGHGGIADGLDAGDGGGTSPDEPPLPNTFQYVLPSDALQSTEEDFRGISSWELSLLLEELTRRTTNVTVILDCCHAAQMVRGDAADEDARPRAVDRTRTFVRRHLAAVQARRRNARTARFDPRGNANAVRLVACDESQQASSRPDEHGVRCGVLTHATIATLEELGDAQVSWQTLGEAIRARVRQRTSRQLPRVEGPVKRRLFSLEEAAVSIPIEGESGGARLRAGRILGVSKGDVYGVTPLGAAHYDPARAIARVRVVSPEAIAAAVEPLEWLNGHEALPPLAAAWPLEVGLARQPVRIEAPAEGRRRLEEAVTGSRRLCLAEAGEPAIAELRLREGALEVLDEDGVALRAGAGGWSLEDAIHQLEDLAAAQALRALQGEGLAPGELEVEWGTVAGDGARIPRQDGAAVSPGDRIYIKLRNPSSQTRHAHVFNIGLCGKITRLSNTAPLGIALRPLEEALVGPHGAPRPDFKVSWPACMPADEPRTDRLVVIATAAPTDLGALETSQAGARGNARGGGTSLQRLLAQLHDGGTRSTDGAAADPFLVVHRAWTLHPLQASVALPRFAIDEDPRGMRGVSARAAWLGGGGAAPREIAIRLRDVTSPREVRIDTLVCTRSADAARTYEAHTFRIPAGAPSPVAHVLWAGPVRDLVEIYAWAAPDAGGGGDLAALLEAARGSAGIAEALDALVVRDERAPWARAGGACAALANLADAQLRRVAPGAAGLVHASFGAPDDHGVGSRRRHRGHGVELDLAIEPS